MHTDDEQSMTLLCRQRRRVFLCVCASLLSTGEEKERKKEKTGRWKKESQEAEQKDEKAHWSKHYNRSQLIATKCLFFEKKNENKRKEKKTW